MREEEEDIQTWIWTASARRRRGEEEVGGCVGASVGGEGGGKMASCGRRREDGGRGELGFGAGKVVRGVLIK